MSRWFQNINKKHIIIGLVLTLIIITLFFVRWLYKLNDQIDSQLEKKRFSPPLEFYSAPEKFFKGLSTSSEIIAEAIQTANYRERTPEQTLQENDFTLLNSALCADKLNLSSDSIQNCFLIKKREGTFVIVLGNDDIILDVYDGVDFNSVESVEFEPILFAQFYGKEPIMRTRVELGDTPPICLNALLAIEDNNFLEHTGVSFLGIARAFVKNLLSGKVVQGGSTITQQLIKNYFLTHERTLSRKFKEVFMAMLLETKTSKDDILEAYINEIYMGQNGSFQIRGFGAASEYYFGKPLTDLNLPECSLLASIVNSPGLFNPFKNPDNAIERRKKVLTKLFEQKNITDTELASALATPLPKDPQKVLSEPAPYFVDAVMRWMDEVGVDTTFGLKIETTLNLKAQEAAQKAIRVGIDNLEKGFKSLQELKSQGKNLEGFLVSADPQTGHIQAIVGGKSFKQSQYNRAVQSRRQVGSIIKPFIYLSALLSVTDTGENYTPLTLTDDEKFKIKYEGQEWSPKNYGNKYYGQVPMYFALKSSLNCATASLGLKIGLESAIDLARSAGIESEMKPYPAMTLGVFEVPALEVLQAYSTLALLGEKTQLTMVRRIKSLENEIIYEFVPGKDLVFPTSDAAVLVGMMKQTVLNGTAVGAYLSGFDHPAAGKTGTTSDFKDSWFAGFTPHHVAVAWVGYDDNTPHKLTGSQGAVPIWTQYMKEYVGKFPKIDFPWPEGVALKEIPVEDQLALGIPQDPKRPLEPIQLIFKE